MRTILLLLFATILTSCYVQKTQADSDTQGIATMKKVWIGQNITDVYSIPSWGIPTKEGSDGRGGRIFEYTRRHGGGYVDGKFIYGIWTTIFYVDSEGKIYNVTARKEGIGVE